MAYVCEDLVSNCERCGSAQNPVESHEPSRIGHTYVNSKEACNKFCRSMGASCCHYMNYNGDAVNWKTCFNGNCFCGAYSDDDTNRTPQCGPIAQAEFAAKCYPGRGTKISFYFALEGYF